MLVLRWKEAQVSPILLPKKSFYLLNIMCQATPVGQEEKIEGQIEAAQNTFQTIGFMG